MKKAENDMLPEDILSDQNIAPGDRIIITDESGVNTVTTREKNKVFNARKCIRTCRKTKNI